MKHFRYKLYVLFIGVCVLFSSCNVYQEVEYKGVENISFGKIKDGTIPIYLEVRVFNPNKYNIKIKKSFFDLYLNGKHLGKSSSSKDILIKKNKEDTYSILLKLKSSEITKSLFSSLGFLFGQQLSFEIKGEIVAKALGIKKKFNIDENQKISASDFLF